MRAEMRADEMMRGLYLMRDCAKSSRSDTSRRKKTLGDLSFSGFVLKGKLAVGLCMQRLEVYKVNAFNVLSCILHNLRISDKLDEAPPQNAFLGLHRDLAPGKPLDCKVNSQPVIRRASRQTCRL